MLDWQLTIDGNMLVGGLHRDGYALILNGKDDAILAFAVWYRALIAPAVALFLYEWADEGIELNPGMTADDIETAEQKLHQQYF